LTIPAWSFITALDLVREGAESQDRTADELGIATARSDEPLDRAARGSSITSST
jgi:hypothetical protein